MSKPKWLATPPGLTGTALSIWNYYAPSLVAGGQLTPDNAELFRSLCRLLVVAQAAEAEIEQNGVVIMTPSGARRGNPACDLLLRAQKQAAPLLREFGLAGTPGSIQ